MKKYNLAIEESTKLFDKLCSTYFLKEAFKEVKKNKGAPGIDGITTSMFELRLDEEIRKLQEELLSWKYKPKPVRAVEIPKPGGGKRQLGIPCVRDRVAQAAIKLLLEPIWEPKFSDNSYGFRPGRSQHDAIKSAQRIVKSGKEHVVDIDLSKFFDRINHNRLISRLTNTIEDKRILRIIGTMLRSGIMKDGVTRTSNEGSVQGSPLSPLLSNIVLDELDKELEARGLEFCRYADDCNIYVHSKKSAERVMRNVSKFIEQRLRLIINQEKSKVALSKFVKFLGLTIIVGTIAISIASMENAMAKVKELTPRGTYHTIGQAVGKINKWYIGWSAYYGITQYPSQLVKIEAHIRRRLRARIIRQQKKRRNLYNKFTKRGVSRKQARIAFSNKKTWAMSLTNAAHRAFSNNWFINDLGLKIRSNEKRPGWRDRREWIKLPKEPCT